MNLERVEEASEYKEDDRMSFEKSLVLIAENFLIVFNILGGRVLRETGSLQIMLDDQIGQDQ